jgi:hypothetical protein
LLFDLWEHFFHKGAGEVFAVLLHDARAVHAAASATGHHFGRAVSEGVHHNHRLGLTLRNQVVEDDVGTAGGEPSGGIVAQSVEKIQDRVGLLAVGIVVGRRVDVEVAVVADDGRLIEVMRHYAARSARGFPAYRTGNAHHALSAGLEVGLQQRIAGIGKGRAVHIERVGVDFGLEWAGGNAPDALFVLLQSQAATGQAVHGNLFGIGRAQTEGHCAVGRNLGRLDRRLRPTAASRGGLRPRGGGREQNQ